jgi:NADPH:quinone reductase-like Zn-dependent oxidoreductase
MTDVTIRLALMTTLCQPSHEGHQHRGPNRGQWAAPANDLTTLPRMVYTLQHMTYSVRSEEIKMTTTSAVEPEASRRTMQAMVQDRYGHATDVLSQRTVPVPEIDAHEILVRIRSSSVNAMEWHLVNGKPYIFRASFGFRPQPTPGADLSGVIEAVGSDVGTFRVGDEVFGEIWTGAYAQYARANEEDLALKPKGVTFREAAAVGVAGLTALQGLRDVAGVEPGQKVLINGASGGVGTYAIQIAKVLGAEVTAVCSTRNVELARSLGADRVIDYTRQDFTATDDRFDVMFDLPGNRSLRACKRLLAPGGTYVMVGGAKGDWIGPLPRLLAAKTLFGFSDKRETSFTVAGNRSDLEYLGQLLATGEIHSVIQASVPLSDVATAVDRQGEFHALGKTVVVVKDV